MFSSLHILISRSIKTIHRSKEIAPANARVEVNSLHLHMVDMKAVGPTFRKLEYKNCPLNAILKARRVRRVRRPKILPRLLE
jgi:hypothetical protein